MTADDCFLAARGTGSVVVSTLGPGLDRGELVSDWPVLVLVLMMVLEHAWGQKGGERKRGVSD